MPARLRLRDQRGRWLVYSLFLSPHTVRDYVKRVFEKVGVSSRNELVARLFGEHHKDPLHATLGHVG